MKLDFFNAISSFFAGIKTEDKGQEKHVKFQCEKIEHEEAECPKARYGSSSIVVPNHQGHKLYIFGGTTEGGAYTYFDDLWELTVTKGLNEEDIVTSFKNCETTGDIPSGRFGHRAVYLPSTNEMLLFGGYSRDNIGTTNLYALPLDGTFKWRSVDTMGREPSPRFTHSMNIVDNGKRVIVFGGFNSQDRLNDVHVLETTTMTWTQVVCKGTAPSPRNSHACFVTSSQGITRSAAVTGNNKISTAQYNADIMYVFGGRTETERYNDLYALNTHTMEWKQVASTGSAPVPSSSQTVNVCGRHVCVFGGFDGKESLNSLHLLDLDTMHWTSSEQHSSITARDRHIAEVVYTGETSAKIVVFGGFDGSNMLGDLNLVTIDLPSNLLPVHFHQLMLEGVVSDLVPIKVSMEEEELQSRLVLDMHRCLLHARMCSGTQ